jgi:hypothetical protein
MAAHSSPLGIVLARIECRRRGCFDHSAQRRGPERMRLPLDILEGQNLARKNHHGVGPRRAERRGPERMRLPLDILEVKTSPGKITTASDHVAPLDSDGQFAPPAERLEGGSVP